jgi:hypothetical protein
MLPSIQYLKDVYEFEEANQTFVIKLALDKYSLIWNQLDPSPIRRRDISSDLKDFLEDCSTEIPTRYAVRLRFYFKDEQQDLLLEREIRDGLKNYFSYILNVTSSQVRLRRMRALKYALISFSAITLSVLVAQWLPESVLEQLLFNGLTIAGWVFLWETISVNFIQMDDTKAYLNKYRRLLSAAVEFVYHAVD